MSVIVRNYYKKVDINSKFVLKSRYTITKNNHVNFVDLRWFAFSIPSGSLSFVRYPV